MVSGLTKNFARILFIVFGVALACVSLANAESDYSPIAFLDSQVAKYKTQFDARGAAKERFAAPKIVESRAVRNDWLKHLYAMEIVESSELTRVLADKLIMAKIIEAYGGDAAIEFHPKTMGLKYFLEKHALLGADKSVAASVTTIEAALEKEFPMGFIVKPAAGINSMGKGNGFYFSKSKFLADLMREDSPVYQKEDFAKPYFSELLQQVASGEYLILQENVILAAGYEKVLKPKEFVEVRVHTLGGSVVPEATFARWKETDKVTSKEMITKAAEFTQRFLDLMPGEFKNRMGFGLDVAVLDNGALRILDINTNRGGSNKQWSGYIPRPNVIGAYTRFIEEKYNVHFAGLDGFLLRHNLGNYSKYLIKEYFEGLQ